MRSSLAAKEVWSIVSSSASGSAKTYTPSGPARGGTSMSCQTVSGGVGFSLTSLRRPLYPASPPGPPPPRATETHERSQNRLPPDPPHHGPRGHRRPRRRALGHVLGPGARACLQLPELLVLEQGHPDGLPGQGAR